MRPVFLSEVPVFVPYACKRCGVGNGFRQYFIDIGVDNDMAQDMRDQGAIYFCDECSVNLIREMQELMDTYERDHPIFVKLEEVEDGSGTDSQSDVGAVEESELDSSGSLEFDSESEGPNQPTEPTVDDSDPDEHFSESLADLSARAPERGTGLTF